MRNIFSVIIPVIVVIGLAYVPSQTLICYLCVISTDEGSVLSEGDRIAIRLL